MILHSTDEPPLAISALSYHIPLSEGRGEVSLREFSLWEVFIFPCFS